MDEQSSIPDSYTSLNTDLNKPKRSFIKKTTPFIIFMVFILFINLIYFINKKLISVNKTNNNTNRPTVSQATEIRSVKTETFESASSISEAHNGFGINILKKLLVEDKNKNIFISPSSIELVLSMVYNGANNKTKTEMGKVLGFEKFDLDTVNAKSSKLISELKNTDSKVDISIANSIWARKNVKFEESFYNINIKNYSAEVRVIDFDDTAVTMINKWVAEATKEKIRDIVSSPISPNAMMYLINAVYFKGSWTNEFDKKLTTDKQFTTADGKKIKNPFMTQNREDFQYFEDENIQLIKLPYGKEKKLGMYVFLPKNDINIFVNEINSHKITDLISKLKNKAGTIDLPKFKIEYDKTLNKPLISLGIKAAFGNGADFSNMTKTEELYISVVKHKAYIDVNEEGTEAAAATIVAMQRQNSFGIDNKPFYMEVNHPFFFIIRDDLTGEFIFTGIIKNPKS